MALGIGILVDNWWESVRKKRNENAVFNCAALGFSLDSTHSCHLGILYPCAQIERSRGPLLGCRPGGTWRGRALRGNKAKEPKFGECDRGSKGLSEERQKECTRAAEYLKRWVFLRNLGSRLASAQYRRGRAQPDLKLLVGWLFGIKLEDPISSTDTMHCVVRIIICSVEVHGSCRIPVDIVEISIRRSRQLDSLRIYTTSPNTG